MDRKKVNQTGDIPAGILKACTDSYISVLLNSQYLIRKRLLFSKPT